MDIKEAPSYTHPRHPRSKGFWVQYSGLGTGLRGRVFYSDVIYPEDSWQNYAGQTSERVDIEKQNPENYHDTHNHYQTVLYEVLNFTPGANAVPVWGDGQAVANGALAWGAFFSARSIYVKNVSGSTKNFDPLQAAAPSNLHANLASADFDCQITGIEVDVLNSGKPGVPPNMSKTGIQIVGFGNPNSHAVSVMCENFNSTPDKRRGQFETGIYFEQSIHPDYGRTLVGDFDTAKIGIDFRRPVFKQGAFHANPQGAGTGILFNDDCAGGEIYAGKRWSDLPDDAPKWLTIRMGSEGFRVMSADLTRELLAIDTHGRIYLNGDVYVNGRALGTVERQGPMQVFRQWTDRIIVRVFDRVLEQYRKLASAGELSRYFIFSARK